jgi:hypothetical protein
MADDVNYQDVFEKKTPKLKILAIHSTNLN